MIRMRTRQARSRAAGRMNGRLGDMRRYLDRFLVEALSRAAVIPTYSFPVHSNSPRDCHGTRPLAPPRMIERCSSIETQQWRSLSMPPGAESWPVAEILDVPQASHGEPR